MARICLLKAKMLRLYLSFKELSGSALKSIMRDLQSWQEALPEEMHFEASGQEHLEIETRRSILHVHLLYLGAVMLLYRRVVSQFPLSRVKETMSGPFQQPLSDVFINQSSQAALAAGMSAKILKLLQEDESIFKRCWLVM
jgi:hypothetical protein